MTKCSKVYRAPLNGDYYSSRTTQNYYRESSTNKTQPNYKYVSCFASIICFSLLQSFSLSMFIFRTSSHIILLPALRQKTEIL